MPAKIITERAGFRPGEKADDSVILRHQRGRRTGKENASFIGLRMHIDDGQIAFAGPGSQALEDEMAGAGNLFEGADLSDGDPKKIRSFFSTSSSENRLPRFTRMRRCSSANLFVQFVDSKHLLPLQSNDPRWVQRSLWRGCSSASPSQAVR